MPSHFALYPLNVNSLPMVNPRSPNFKLTITAVLQNMLIALIPENKQNDIFNQERCMLGSGELIVILCVVLILFGGKRLPEFAKSLGKGIREFKKACQGIDDEEEKEEPSSIQCSSCPCKSKPTEKDPK
jgi:sec-independent protein translocase protein TatA